MATHSESRKSNPFSEREIIRLHQLAASGTTGADLSRLLGCNINTIVDHLAMRVCYPRRIYKAIGKLKPIPHYEPLSIYDASIFLPGWPSRDKVYRLVKHGILEATKEGRNLMTTFAAIRKCSQEMLPAGIWISNRAVESFIPLDAIPRLIPFARQLTYWPSREIRFYPMNRVVSLSLDIEEPINIPAVIIHRCLEIERVAGVATI